MGSSDKKSKKDRKRSRSRSRERSRRRRDSSSDSSRDYDKKSDDHRRKKDGSKKADKEKMKAMETPEEKRARRLAKKMKKEEKRAASKGEGYLPSSVTYTNLDNPFNDPHLADTFVWKKKLDEEGRPVKKRDIEKETRERVQRNLREMDELKRNRDSRLAAREEMDMMKREEEKAAYGDWDQKEAQFQLQQAKLRSKIRIEQNRPKPIDLLIRYIDYAEEPSDLSEKERQEEFELEEPSKYIRGLSYGDYEDLFEDFKICKQIDAGKNADYWSDIQTLADEEFRKLKNTRQQSATQAVQGDIDKRMKKN